MAPSAIRVDHVAKSYGPRPALRDISFEVGPGEAVGYLGPNGAGKTTTLRLLAGLARPDQGSVELLGTDPARAHGSALRRVGALVETPGVVPYVTARDLLDHVARVKQVSPASEGSEIRALSDRLGFADHLDRPIGTLSTGLTRRVLLAAALVGDPEVLLLDEPTLGLDPAARADLRSVLAGLRRDGRTLLLSTHLLDDVEEVCTRVLFLRDGQLVGDEPVTVAHAGPDGAPIRVVSLEFARPVPETLLREAIGPVGEIEARSATELRVRLPGDASRQVDLLAAIVRAGLPLLGAGDGSPSLGERYLERVGREDPT